MRALIRRWLGSARPAAWDLSAYPPSPRIHPGHGAALSPAQAQANLDAFLAHLPARQQALRHWLQAHGGPDPQALPGAADTTWALAWRPDGQIIASAARGAQIELRDAVSGALKTPPLAGHEAIITSLAWSPDGHLLASAGQEGRLLLWDTTNPAKAPLRLIDAGPPLRRVSIRADGRQLAAALLGIVA